jgi:hypothetical protein
MWPIGRRGGNRSASVPAREQRSDSFSAPRRRGAGCDVKSACTRRPWPLHRLSFDGDRTHQAINCATLSAARSAVRKVDRCNIQAGWVSWSVSSRGLHQRTATKARLRTPLPATTAYIQSMLRKRSPTGFSPPLPKQIHIHRHMKVRTLADVRAFLLRLTDDQQQHRTWQHVARTTLQAAEDGSVLDVSVALQLTLQSIGMAHTIGSKAER